MSQLFPTGSGRGVYKTLTVRRAPSHKTRGILVAGSGKSPRVFPCALGRSGIGRKRGEGDGITPLGRFGLLEAMVRKDRGICLNQPLNPTVIRREDGWCDETGHPCYNQAVTLPFAASHEKLWRDDHLYDVVIVLDHNQTSRLSVGGSAIFFHLAQESIAPTEGCVAISRAAMDYLLPRIDSSTVMRIV